MRRVDNATLVFGLAFASRLLATPLSALKINPYSQADSVLYVLTAKSYATALAGGPMPDVSSFNVRVWGQILAPFWLLPGPSAEYARVMNVLLGAIAVYNVYAIATHYHSKKAGLLAALPLIMFPTNVLLHASLMREAPIHLGITTAVRMITVPSSRLTRARQAAIAVGALGLAVLLRPESIPVYLLAIGVGGIGYLYRSLDGPDTDRLSRVKRGAVLLLPAIGVVLAIRLLPRILSLLARMRRHRMGERTRYLSATYPETIPELLRSGWLLVLYFLFAPFPWMVTTLADAVVAVEGLVTLVYAGAAVLGVTVGIRRHPVWTLGLLTGFSAGVVAFSLVNGTYGAASRYRQMFVWVLFVFGGIGLVDHVRIRFLDTEPVPQ